MTVFEYHKAGNSEQRQKQALAFLFQQGSTGRATQGVLDGLGVTQTATASASVLVDAGAGIVQSATLNGASLEVNDSQITLDVLTANPMGGTPRNDIVVLDQATGSVRVIVGTPAATPTDPTVPSSAIALARLRHAASATTVPTSAIDDLRTFTQLAKPQAAAWKTISLPSGWTAPDGVGWRVKQVGDVVYFQGAITNSSFGGSSTWVTLGNLPSGITAPSAVTALAIGSNTGVIRRAQVNTDGTVVLYASATSTAWWVVGGAYLIG